MNILYKINFSKRAELEIKESQAKYNLDKIVRETEYNQNKLKYDIEL